MKCVGIIGAMEQEVARLKEVMENVSITTRAGMDFYEGVLEGKKNGMGVSVGRLREDTVYDYKFIGLSHNTVRGYFFDHNSIFSS